MNRVRLYPNLKCLWFGWMYLVEVVVFLGFEEVEGLPLLFTGSSQQVVEDMVVPMKRYSGFTLN